jgi:hypothetical protein
MRPQVFAVVLRKRKKKRGGPVPGLKSGGRADRVRRQAGGTTGHTKSPGEGPFHRARYETVDPRKVGVGRGAVVDMSQRRP